MGPAGRSGVSPGGLPRAIGLTSAKPTGDGFGPRPEFDAGVNLGRSVATYDLRTAFQPEAR